MKTALFPCSLSVVAAGWALIGCADDAPKPPEASPPGASTDVTSALVSGTSDGNTHLHRPASPGTNNIDTLNGCKLPAHLTAYGGARASAVQVVPVFWGSSVNSTTTSTIQNSLTELEISDLNAWLVKQYAMPQMNVQAPITITPHNTATSLSQNDVQAELTYQITHGGLPGAGTGYHYVLHFPSTVTVAGQCVSWCAFNSRYSYIVGTPPFRVIKTVYYSVMPDFATTNCGAPPNPFVPNCLFSETNWYNAFTRTETHEIIEALTDEMGGGWQDRSQPSSCGTQIGDLCNGMSDTVGSTTIQKMWSNAANNCVTHGPGASNDVDGDGYGDFALVSGNGWNTVPVGFYSSSTGVFNPTNAWEDNFPGWTTQGRTVMGDFNGDGLADLAVTGGSGWGSLPVAFSTGSGGSFNITNIGIDSFAGWASTSGVLQPVAGDFDGDGLSDIAIAGGTAWNSIPVAFSNGDGSFTVANITDSNSTTFEALIHNSDQTTLQLLSGDFNGDGRTDLALVGGTANGSPWTTIPVAFATATRGAFTVVQKTVADFPIYATQHAYAVTGDFDGDSRADIALTGGANWNTVPFAYSNGDGTFAVTNMAYGSFSDTAKAQHVHVVAGDYNGDGISDILLVGASGWSTVTVLSPLGRGGSNQIATMPDSWLASVASQWPLIRAIGTSDAYSPFGP